MTIPSMSRRKSKYTPRTVPVSDTSERLATSAMIASLDSEGRETVSAPFGHALVDLAKSKPATNTSATDRRYSDSN